MLNQRLYDYLANISGFDNQCEFTGMKDPHGRFLLPLDLIAYLYPSDEGIELATCGLIKIIDEDNDLIKVDPHKSYLELGFRPRWVVPGLVVKLPIHNKPLMKDFDIFLRNINRSNIQNKTVHIHGFPITVI